jgi:hypothetical protein
MLPTNLISYIHGCHEHAVTRVIYEIKCLDKNNLEIKIVEPFNLLWINSN